MKAEHKLFEQAKELVIKKQECSLSMLKEHFNIGDNSAGMLMDELEDHSVVAEFEGNRSRRVLMP